MVNMKYKISPLSTGHSSLEFSSDMMNSVKRIAVARWGDFKVQKRSSYEVIHIDGCAFVSEAEYDEVCLISEDAKGDGVLGEIYSALEAEQK